MTKLFVLGRSASGKTPVAKQVAAALGVPHVMASEWVRRIFPANPRATADERQRQIEEMTRFSLQALRADPLACLRFLDRAHDMSRSCVVEGMRNPFDFVRTFDPKADCVVFLTHTDTALSPTAFERGLDVVRTYLDWLVDMGLVDRAAVIEKTFADFGALDGAIADVAAFARPRFPAEPESGVLGRRARVHAEIEPLPLFVRKDVLFGNDAKYASDWVPCRAFVFSSYPGSAPTFQIVLDDGAVFSYVPPQSLSSSPSGPRAPVLELRDLAYHNCPDGDVVINAFDALQGSHLVLLKHRDLWMKADYRFSIDWYRGNDLLHCIVLENGQPAFLPHHKIKLHGKDPGFEPYKKMRNEWHV